MTIELEILTVVADSLALVRPEDNIYEKDMYPFKIQKELKNKIYVNSKAVKSNSSTIENEQVGFVYHAKGASASYLVIGLGIVDCSPRLFSKKMKQFLDCASKIPLVSKFVNRYIAYKSRNRFALTKNKPMTQTSVLEYESNMNQIVSNFQKYNTIKEIFLLTIAFPGPYLSERSWGIEENIKQFNSILYKMAQSNPSKIHIIDVYEFTQKNPQYILADGHHISIEVHDFIAASIVKIIKNQEAI